MSSKFNGKQQGTRKAAGEKVVAAKKTSQRDRIRLLKHLLQKEDLSAHAKERAQKELDQLLNSQADSKRSEKERKLAQRYHKVRFFERVKIERHINQLERQAEKLTEEQQKELEEWRRKLQYVKHFPPGEKFVSLLKDAETPEAQARLESERARLYALVDARLAAEAQAAADVAALTEADEGRGRNVTNAAKTTTVPSDQATKSEAPQKKQQHEPKAPGNSTNKAVSGKATHGNALSTKTATTTAAAQLGSESGLDDDDFFLSDDEEDEGAGNAAPATPGNAKQRSVAAGLVARAWDKPSSEGDADDDDDDDEEEDQQNTSDAGDDDDDNPSRKPHKLNQGEGQGTDSSMQRRDSNIHKSQDKQRGGAQQSQRQGTDKRKADDDDGGKKRRKRRRKSKAGDGNASS